MWEYVPKMYFSYIKGNLTKYRNPINKSKSAWDFTVVPPHQGQPVEPQETTFISLIYKNTRSYLKKKKKGKKNPY